LKRNRGRIPETIQEGRRATHVLNDHRARGSGQTQGTDRPVGPGKELVITDNKPPVAKLVDARPAERKLGTMRGTVQYMTPDFDAPLDDFKEYAE
jgi:hypothetical protein